MYAVALRALQTGGYLSAEECERLLALVVRPVTGGYVDGKPVVVGELRVHEELFTREDLVPGSPEENWSWRFGVRPAKKRAWRRYAKCVLSLRRSVRQSASLQMCMPKGSTC